MRYHLERASTIATPGWHHHCEELFPPDTREGLWLLCSFYSLTFFPTRQFSCSRSSSHPLMLYTASNHIFSKVSLGIHAMFLTLLWVMGKFLYFIIMPISLTNLCSPQKTWPHLTEYANLHHKPSSCASSRDIKKWPIFFFSHPHVLIETFKSKSLPSRHYPAQRFRLDFELTFALGVFSVESPVADLFNWAFDTR